MHTYYNEVYQSKYCRPSYVGEYSVKKGILTLLNPLTSMGAEKKYLSRAERPIVDIENFGIVTHLSLLIY